MRFCRHVPGVGMKEEGTVEVSQKFRWKFGGVDPCRPENFLLLVAR